MPQLDISCHKNEDSRITHVLVLIELLAEGDPCEPQTIQNIGKTIGFSPYTENKAPMLKTTYT